MTSSIRIRDSVVRGFIADVFQCLGVGKDDAWVAADVLVRADLRGVESHGVNNLWQYVDPLREGTLNPRPDIRVLRSSPVLASIDGDGGMGLVVGTRAMELCIAKAQEHGLAAVTVRRSRHFGMASYYALMCLEHDMIGCSMTNNSGVGVIPTFGGEPMLSTNPISVVAPTRDEPPFEMDFATSVAAMSKIGLAIATGTTIPLGWALDDKGQPTDDPQAAWDARSLLPLGSTRELGSHKGYGLAVLVDILTGVLGGGMYGNSFLRNPPDDEKLRVSSSHFFAALQVEVLQPIEEFKARMDDMLRALKGSRKAGGQDRIYTHGEMEFEAEQERLRIGIPYHPALVSYLHDLASEFAVRLEI